MKSTFVATAALAGALGLAAAQYADAQASAERVQIPTEGLTLSFTEIDRNNDSSISVEEWNDFVKTLHSRAGRADSSGTPGTISSGAAGGATSSSEPPKVGEPRK